MSTGTPGSIAVSYLPTSRTFPEDDKELIPVLSKAYIETAQAVNRRTIGTFNTFQAVTGNQYYSLQNNDIHNPIQFRQSYRRLYPFGAIAAGATLNIDHQITGIVQFVSIYGNCITDFIVNPDGKYLPIPYVSVNNVNEQIQIYVNDSQIFILNGAGADNIVSGTIVLEYLLN